MKLKTRIISLPFLSIYTILFSQNSKILDTVQIKKEKPIEAIIKQQYSKQYTGGALADIINKEPGVEMLRSGANNTKPIIEGLKNNRILILTDGVKLNSQDWADQHAPEIDMASFQTVKIIKGARGVRYGAGALGGVVLLEPKALSFAEKIKGDFSIAGHSNDSRMILNSHLEGAYKDHIAWQIQQSYHRSGDYKTKDYFVNNTGLKQYNTYAAIGYKSNIIKAKISANKFVLENGVFYGSLNGNIKDFNHKISLGRPIETLPASNKIRPPKENVEHFTLKSQAELRLNKMNSVELNYNFQKNTRKEFELRRLDKTSVPTQDMNLSSHFIESIWHYGLHKDFHTQLGVQYLYQNNYNTPGTGVAPSIPNYKLNNYASFFISEYKKNLWQIALGIRYDKRTNSALGYDWLGQLYGSKRDFSNFSYNTAIHYQIGKNWHYNIDFGMAWRSPEPYELYVNGKQHGLPIYYVGDKNLKSEKGLKLANKLEYRTSKMQIGISAFAQPIHNFIYQLPSNQYRYLFSGPAVIFRTYQTKAFFRGGDISLSWKPFPKLSYTGNAAMVMANDMNTKGYLPMIPPFSIYQNIQWQIPTSSLKNLYLSLDHHYYAKQRRFDPKQDLIPDTPSAYHLLGIEMGAELYYHKNKTCLFLLKVDNLTNELYKSYTDHFRYFVHGKGMDIQLKAMINF